MSYKLDDQSTLIKNTSFKKCIFFENLNNINLNVLKKYQIINQTKLDLIISVITNQDITLKVNSFDVLIILKASQNEKKSQKRDIYINNILVLAQVQ